MYVMKNGCSIDVFYYFVYSYTNLSLNLVHTSAVFSKCFASLTQETYKKCVFFFRFFIWWFFFENVPHLTRVQNHTFLSIFSEL